MAHVRDGRTERETMRTRGVIVWRGCRDVTSEMERERALRENARSVECTGRRDGEVQTGSAQGAAQSERGRYRARGTACVEHRNGKRGR